MSKISIKEKCQAGLVLHGLGDTIGFKNGEWEFNYHKQVNYAFTLEIVYEFIQLGGINQINLDGWIVSDDTILHMMIGEIVINHGNKSANELIKITEDMLIKTARSKQLDDRAPGNATIHAINEIESGLRMKQRLYDSNQGGSGVSMRNPVIGMRFYGEKNRDKLIEVALVTGLATHKGAIGFLGGIVSALFTAFGMEGVNLYEWGDKMLAIIKSDKVKKMAASYLEQSAMSDFQNDYDIFVNKWTRYLNEKFNNGKPVENKAMRNLVYRMRYYHDMFGYYKSKFANPGGGGDDSVIIAYDALIDAGDKWETLVFYSMLHMGDSDTTGCLAGCWYGVLYGFNNIPPNNLKYLEFKNKLMEMGDKLSKF